MSGFNLSLSLSFSVRVTVAKVTNTPASSPAALSCNTLSFQRFIHSFTSFPLLSSHFALPFLSPSSVHLVSFIPYSPFPPAFFVLFLSVFITIFPSLDSLPFRTFYSFPLFAFSYPPLLSILINCIFLFHLLHLFLSCPAAFILQSIFYFSLLLFSLTL